MLSYPLDENVFGIFDLGGSAAEYLDAQFASRADERLFLRASWAQTEGDVLTARSAAGVRHDVVDIAIGFRLAAYRR